MPEYTQADLEKAQRDFPCECIPKLSFDRVLIHWDGCPAKLWKDLATFRAAARQEERERCKKAVCIWCRDGIPMAPAADKMKGWHAVPDYSFKIGHRWEYCKAENIVELGAEVEP